jgi:serine/threonine protein kinase
MTEQINDLNQRFGDRYTIRSLLGRGGMADVYLAQDTHLMRDIALKILRFDSEFDTKHNEKQKIRLLREARAAAGLSHPGIVVIHDLGECDGRPFISMEYIQGRNLRDLHADTIAQGRCLPVRDILNIAHQVASALDYAHSKKVIHRDIKPENIMVTPSGVCKITDFGIARSHVAGLRTLTPHGKLACTWHYAAPEYFQGEDPSATGDQFSFGCVLYELLTGRMAFTGEEAHQVWYRITMVQPVPPSDIAWDLPETVNPVLLKMLAKTPQDRYASCSAAVQAFENAVAGISPDTRFHIQRVAADHAAEPATGMAPADYRPPGDWSDTGPDGDEPDSGEYIPTTFESLEDNTGHQSDQPESATDHPWQFNEKPEKTEPDSGHTTSPTDESVQKTMAKPRDLPTRTMLLRGNPLRRRVRVLLLILVVVAGAGAFLLVTERLFHDHWLSRSASLPAIEVASIESRAGHSGTSAPAVPDNTETLSELFSQIENHYQDLPALLNGQNPVDADFPGDFAHSPTTHDSDLATSVEIETLADSISITPSPRPGIVPTKTPIIAVATITLDIPVATVTPEIPVATVTPDRFFATATPGPVPASPAPGPELPQSTPTPDYPEPTAILEPTVTPEPTITPTPEPTPEPVADMPDATATPENDRPSRRSPWVPF